MDSIGAQLWLLGYDTARGAPRGGRQLSYAVAAGLLAELVLGGRIGGAEQCEVVSAEPTGFPASDELLVRIAAAPTRTWLGWIKASGRTAVRLVASELEDRCGVVRYERRIARFLTVRRHALLDPAKVERLRSAAAGALSGASGVPIDPRLGVVASLAATARLPLAGESPVTLADGDRLTTLGAPVGSVRTALAAAVRSPSNDVSAVRLPAWM